MSGNQTRQSTKYKEKHVKKYREARCHALYAQQAGKQSNSFILHKLFNGSFLVNIPHTLGQIQLTI